MQTPVGRRSPKSHSGSEGSVKEDLEPSMLEIILARFDALERKFDTRIDDLTFRVTRLEERASRRGTPVGSRAQSPTILREDQNIPGADETVTKGTPTVPDTLPKPVKKRDTRRYSTLHNLAEHYRTPWRDESVRELLEEEDTSTAQSSGNAEEEGDQQIASEFPTRTQALLGGKKPGKLFRELKKNANLPNVQQTVVMREERTCKVRINELKLSKVARAVKQILDFQEEEQTTVRLQKVVSGELRDHLREVYHLGHAEISEMDLSDLLRVIAKETRVFNCVGFYEELRDSLRHIKIMEWKKVTTVTFEQFYFQQLKLIDLFRTMLSIMLEFNKDWCPRVDDKEYGLVRLFKNLNDRDYVRYVFGCMNKLQFDTMNEFFDEFTAILVDHYQICLAARQLPFEANIEAKNKLDEYNKRKRDLFSKNNEKHPSPMRSTSYKDYDHRNNRDSHALTHIDGYVSDDSDFDRGPEQINLEYPSSSDDEEGNIDLRRGSAKDVTSSQDLEPDPTAVVNEQEVSFMASSQDKPAGDTSSRVEKFGCLRQMLYGKCNKPQCKYNHNSQCLRTSAVEMRDKLNAFLKAEDGSTGRSNPTSILRRDRFGDSRP